MIRYFAATSRPEGGKVAKEIVVYEEAILLSHIVSLCICVHICTCVYVHVCPPGYVDFVLLFVK